MRQLLKVGATAVIVACASLIVWRAVVIPYSCNIHLKNATNNLGSGAVAFGDHARSMEIARRTIVELATLRGCLSG